MTEIKDEKNNQEETLYMLNPDRVNVLKNEMFTKAGLEKLPEYLRESTRKIIRTKNMNIDVPLQIERRLPALMHVLNNRRVSANQLGLISRANLTGLNQEQLLCEAKSIQPVASEVSAIVLLRLIEQLPDDAKNTIQKDIASALGLSHG